MVKSKSTNIKKIFYDGKKVAVLGRPNAGKSTFINNLSGFSTTNFTGFKNLDNEESIIANCLNIPHNEKEMVRESYDSKNFNFDWSK